MTIDVDKCCTMFVHAPMCPFTHSTESIARNHNARGFVGGVFLFARTPLQRHDFSGLAGNLGRLTGNLGRLACTRS